MRATVQATFTTVYSSGSTETLTVRKSKRIFFGFLATV
jgi:hypothetical protein